jgi:hypothetical protein
LDLQNPQKSLKNPSKHPQFFPKHPMEAPGGRGPPSPVRALGAAGLRGGFAFGTADAAAGESVAAAGGASRGLELDGKLRNGWTIDGQLMDFWMSCTHGV